MGILEYAILGKQAGSGGSGGGSGAKLYRHDIMLYNDDGCYGVYFTIFNTDSTNYTSELKFNWEDAAYEGEHPEGVYDFIPTHDISVTGMIVDEYGGYGGGMAYKLNRQGDVVSVEGTTFVQGGPSTISATFNRTWGQIFDHVTQIL